MHTKSSNVNTETVWWTWEKFFSWDIFIIYMQNYQHIISFNNYKLTLPRPLFSFRNFLHFSMNKILVVFCCKEIKIFTLLSSLTCVNNILYHLVNNLHSLTCVNNLHPSTWNNSPHNHIATVHNSDHFSLKWRNFVNF